MMLGALVKDATSLAGIDVVTTRDARLTVPALLAECRVIDGDETPWAEWQAMMEAADAVWPIAPETGGVLTRFSNLATAAGRPLIGSRPDAVDLAASKLATAERLAACSISAVPTIPADAVLRDTLPPADDGWVLKPDDGVGAEATRLFRRRADLMAALRAPPELRGLVVQPYVEGPAASLSVLCRDGRSWLLSCNRQ